MPEILDDIAYLSQELGPRPAGTEEEQQAALYIADQFKKRVGLRAQIEDFSCNSNYELVNVILFGLPIIFSILSIIRNIFVVPTILVTLVCAVLYVLEVLDKPILSKAFQRGVSQNVVAKYRPEGARGKRSRKIVVVANYDSGKIQQELSLGNGLGILQKCSAAALVAIPLVWIIRAIFALGVTGTPLVVWNIITLVLLLLAAVPVVLFFVHNAAQYNEAANANAAGVAALIELADRINNTFLEDDVEAEIHGEEAAREAGLIPEGAEVEYAVKAPAAPAKPELSEEERLQAAKAAVAALTGKPLREYAPAPRGERPAPKPAPAPAPQPADLAPEPAPAEEAPIATAADEQAVAPEPLPEQEAAIQAPLDAPLADQAPVVDDAYSEQPYVTQTVGTPIPDWYRKAQEKADKSHWNEKPVRRSRYASALDEAVASSRVFFEAANRATGREETVIQENFGPGIVEVPAPAAADAPAWAAPRPAIDQEAPLAADFMVAQPEIAQPAPEEQTAPIPTVAAEADEYVPGSTTAMAPIDVSELRASLNSQARDLQSKPSRNVEPARRRDVDRVVYDGTGEIPQPIEREDQLVLPELESSLPPISELKKQRAPLADASSPSLSSQIPRINLDAFGVSTTGNAEPMDNKRAALRSMLPSMSGSISVEPDRQPQQASGTVSLTGSFAPISATGTVGRVGDELVEGLSPDELYVDDADDSFTETTMTESGAYAGPGYMEMPESRASRFFGRFRKKDKGTRKVQETSAQEWLNVEDDFNPTEVGAARGGWESFGNDDEGRVRSNRRRDDDIFDDDDDWNGGAFSKARADEVGEDVLEDAYEEAADLEAVPADDGYDAPVTPAESYAIGNEIDQIEGFYAKKMELEVWFVALGSEIAGNGGMKAFLSEHAADLRGSLVINLDSLGAGEFAYLDSEGFIREKAPSSRLRRYIKKAQDACGVAIGDGAVHWRDSAASVAMKRGYQAVTLAGMDGPKPAYMAQGDDVLENIDANLLYDRVDFVEAMVRSI